MRHTCERVCASMSAPPPPMPCPALEHPLPSRNRGQPSPEPWASTRNRGQPSPVVWWQCLDYAIPCWSPGICKALLEPWTMQGPAGALAGPAGAQLCGQPGIHPPSSM